MAPRGKTTRENDAVDADGERPTMETLTNTPWRRVWPPVMDAFLTREYQRTTTMERKDYEMDDDGGDGGGDSSCSMTSVTRMPWDDDEAVEIRRLRRVMMQAERGMNMDEEQYTPGEGSAWTRQKFTFGNAENGGKMKEEDPTSEAARELRCVNKIMDMLEKDLHACLPALRMFRRMDKNIDAFEAFVDDMERRFEAGTLPTRDILGEKLLFRWRVFVLSGFVAFTAIFVGIARAIVGFVSSRL